MTAVLLPALLAGLAVALLVGLPGTAPVRLRRVTPGPRVGVGPPARFVPPVAGTVIGGGRRLGAAAVPPVARRAPPAAPLAVVAAVPALVLGGPVPGVLVAAAVLLGLRARRLRQAARVDADERRRAVEACSALADELRAGRPPADAFVAAAVVASGPMAAVLSAAGSAAALGGDVAAALLRGAEPPADVPSTGPAGSRARGGPGSAVPQALRALAACWTVCSASGTGLADAVTRLADGLRAAQDQRRAVDAELAGPRATARLLAALPLLGLLLGTGLGGDPLHVLLGTTPGLVCLVLGCALEAAGIAWTGRLVRRAVA